MNSNYTEVYNKLKEIRLKGKALMNLLKDLNKIKMMKIKEFEKEQESEADSNMDKIINSTEPLDIFKFMRTSIIKGIQSHIQEKFDAIKEETKLFYKDIKAFRQNLDEIEEMVENQMMINKMFDYFSFGEGERIERSELKEMATKFNDKIMTDHFEGKEEIQNAARILQNSLFNNILENTNTTNLDLNNIDSITNTINNELEGVKSEIINNTLLNVENIQNQFEKEFVQMFNDLPKEFKGFVDENFANLSPEEMKKELDAAPVRFMEDKIQKIFLNYELKMKEHQGKMEAKLDKLKVMYNTFIEEVATVHKENKPIRMKTYNDALTKLETFANTLKNKLKALDTSIESEQDLSLKKIMKLKLYLFFIIQKQIQDAIIEVKDFKLKTETDDDILLWKPILKKQIMNAFYHLELDYEDTVIIYEELSVSFDVTGTDDLVEIEESIKKLDLALELLEFKEDFKSKYRNPDFRWSVLEPLIKMSAGTICALTAGNASSNFTLNADKELLIPVNMEAMKNLVTHVLPLVNMICTVMSLYKIIKDLNKDMIDSSMTGFVQMCEDISEFTLCENNMDECSQETQEKILSFLDSPIGNNKMNSVKMSDLKNDSDKAVNVLKDKKQKMNFSSSAEGRLNEIRTNVIKVDSIENANITMDGEGITLSSKFDPNKNKGSETVDSYLDSQYVNIKQSITQEETTNSETVSARILETDTSTSSGSSKYYYSSENYVDVLDIADKAGLVYEPVESSLSNQPSLSQDEADQFLSNFYGDNNSSPKPDDKGSVARVLSGVFLCLIMLVL